VPNGRTLGREIAMRVKIVGIGHFVTETRFKFEGAFSKDLEAGDVIGYIDPDTLEMVGLPAIGQRVAMVVPVSLEDSELEEMYELPDDRPEPKSSVCD
jgi:hypothetical protein